MFVTARYCFLVLAMLAFGYSTVAANLQAVLNGTPFRDDSTAQPVAMYPVPDRCEQTRRVAARLTAVANTSLFKEAKDTIRLRANNDPLREYVIAIGSDSAGSLVKSDVRAGRNTSARVPTLAGAFADLHNHPRNTPPSSGDVYGLLRMNLKDANYTLRYVLTATGTLYALAVIDTAATALFLQRFPAQQSPGYSPLFPDDLLNEFREVRYLHGATEEAAMAYILRKYDAGIDLFRQHQDGIFKRVEVHVLEAGGQMTHTSPACE
jgi:hypothetical protein